MSNVRRKSPRGKYLLNQAHELNQQGQYELALMRINAAIFLYPNNVDAYFDRIFSNRHLRNYQAVIDDCTTIISLDQNNAVAYAIRGEAYIYLKDLHRALENLIRALELDPADVGSVVNCAVVLQDLGNLEGAMTVMNKAIALDPHFLFAYAARARLHQAMGNKDAALADCKILEQLLDPPRTLDEIVHHILETLPQ